MPRQQLDSPALRQSLSLVASPKHSEKSSADALGLWQVATFCRIALATEMHLPRYHIGESSANINLLQS